MSKLPVNFSASVINMHLKAARLLASALLSGVVCPGPDHHCLLLGFFGELPNWSPSFYLCPNCQFSTHHWQVLLKYHFTHNNPLHTLVQCLSFSLKPLPGPIGSILTSTCHFFGFPSWVSSISSVQSLSPVGFFVAPWMHHARLPCPSPTPRACWNSHSSSQWCHPTISSSVAHPAFNHNQHQGLF